MGILDDAIREHLDLKRRHGAREAELREIEDEAFGAGEQPDPFVAGDLYTGVSSDEPDAGNEDPTRLVDAEALGPSEPATESEGLPSSEPVPSPEALRPSDAPPAPENLRPSAPDLEPSDEAPAEPPSPLPGQVELPGQDEIPGQERLDAEPEADEPESYMPSGDTGEQPEAPAPSESLEELIAEEGPFPEDTEAPPASADAEPQSRPLEPQADAQAPPEPESHVPDPPPPPPPAGVEPPGRARGRIDVPTQEHPPPGDTGDLPSLPDEELGRPDTTYEPPPIELPEDEPISDEQPLPEAEPISDEEPLPADDAGGSDGPQLYDFETDEEPVPPPVGETAVDDDFEALGPAEEEAPYLDEEEPYAEEPGTEVRPAVEGGRRQETGSFDTEERPLEADEEEDDLWFEKGPPKDFDFDD